MRTPFAMLVVLGLSAGVAQAQVVVRQVPHASAGLHYTLTPVPDSDDRYRQGYRDSLSSQDLDNDGVVETATVVRPLNAPPTASLDRVTFLGPSGRLPLAPTRAIASEGHQTAVGTINRINISQVEGVDTLIVRVNTSINGPGTYVDLGPIQRWPAGTIKLRDVLTATGPKVDVGGQGIIIAARAALNTNAEFVVLRPSHQVTEN